MRSNLHQNNLTGWDLPRCTREQHRLLMLTANTHSSTLYCYTNIDTDKPLMHEHHTIFFTLLLYSA